MIDIIINDIECDTLSLWSIHNGYPHMSIQWQNSYFLVKWTFPILFA